MKIIGFNISFLPTYSPSLTPVELFFRMIKSEIKSNMHEKEIWFNKEADRIEIYNSISNWNNT